MHPPPRTPPAHALQAEETPSADTEDVAGTQACTPFPGEPGISAQSPAPQFWAAPRPRREAVMCLLPPPHSAWCWGLTAGAAEQKPGADPLSGTVGAQEKALISHGAP